MPEGPKEGDRDNVVSLDVWRKVYGRGRTKGAAQPTEGGAVIDSGIVNVRELTIESLTKRCQTIIDELGQEIDKEQKMSNQATDDEIKAIVAKIEYLSYLQSSAKITLFNISREQYSSESSRFILEDNISNYEEGLEKWRTENTEPQR